MNIYINESNIDETSCLDNQDILDNQSNIYTNETIDYPEFDMSFLTDYHLIDFESSED